ncbi:hypothetical protein [Pedobacter jejuensis]|uniref:Uncharacterized protein n=1 Tax=Pedobacter jejuensis TaxID=1268550 RepID=A0A3N0BNE3_9SPHI|nr:hypothetical protein [Pedobacter jejuensis]RNL50254.1 hypothetical protein D7004_18795 [Pedobacter jejuensis]
MSINSELSSRLNDQQVMMLRLLKNPLPNDDFLQMRKLAVKLLSKQLDSIVENFEIENDIQPDYYNNLRDSHFRSKSK